MKKPTKQDFADLINALTGQSTIDVKNLDRIMAEAKRSYEAKGMEGLFDVMRQVVQAPVSNDFMHQLVERMKTPEGMTELLRELNLPLSFAPVEPGEKKAGRKRAGKK
jgi:hypothetical protein